MTMTGLLDLPPELVTEILRSMGWDMFAYSDKERQSDLAAFALVHPIFRSAAQELLFGGVLSLRNSGRAHLFARSTADPTLARLVKTVSHCPQDTGHAPSMQAILENSTPSTLILGSTLFTHGDASASLVRTLLARTHSITSFAWGFGDGFASIQLIVPLLKAWTGLQSLSLAVNSLQLPADTAVSPPPPYQLEHFSISGVVGSVTSNRDELEWLFGRTNSSLHSLVLRNVLVSPSTTLEAVQILAPRFPLLKHLTLHAPSSRAPTLAELLRLFPALLELSYSDPVGPLAPEEGVLVLPEHLHTLEVHGRRGFSRMDLQGILSGGHAPQLRRLFLIGPFASDPEVKTVVRECEARSIDIEVRRSF